jgi:hypothetical protein
MPYTGILLSDDINNYIPHMKGLPYIIHSPAESLETAEMEMILSTRGARPAVKREEAVLVFIHRLLLPILNNIPGLTKHKAIKNQFGRIMVFGSYLDYETVDDDVQPVFDFGMSQIFPSGSLYCFTTAVLMENPQFVKSILVLLF